MLGTCVVKAISKHSEVDSTHMNDLVKVPVNNLGGQDYNSALDAQVIVSNQLCTSSL